MVTRCIKLLALCFTLAALSLAGFSQSMSPATLATGLSWYAGTGSLAAYSPQVFTATGLTCGTCTWSLKTAYATEDGTTRFDLGTLTACQTTPTVACTYTAPTDYGTGTPTITIQATDGTHTAAATITLQYPANLREAFLHAGRMSVYYSDPWSVWCDSSPCNDVGTGITTFQAWPLWFDPVSVSYPAGTGWNFQPMDRRGWIGFLPPIYSSQQSKIIFTRDGNWFANTSGGIVLYFPVKIGAYTNTGLLQHTDGAKPQLNAGLRDFVHGFGASVGLGTWTPLERGDGEIIAEGFAGSQDNALGLLDLANVDGTTNYYKEAKAYSIATTNSVLIPDVQNNSNISGYWGTHLAVTQPNPGTAGSGDVGNGCTTTVGCAYIPNLYDLDLATCYTSFADGCATLAHGPFSINFGITGLGWDAHTQAAHCAVSGDPSGTDCEYHVHASGTRKGTSQASMNYGPGGGVGEAIGYEVDLNSSSPVPFLWEPDARYPTTGLTPPFTNAPYFGHGDWSFNGSYFMGSGAATCTPNSSHACTDSSSGEHIYDFRTATVGVLKWAGVPANYSANTVTGQSHSTWDTFDLADSFADGWSGSSSGNVAGNTWQAFDDYVPPSQAQAQIWMDYGQKSGGDFGPLFWNPEVSPDGTLAMENVPPAWACLNPGGGTKCENGQTIQDLPWFNAGALLRYPAPPVSLRMTNSGGSAVPAFSFAPNFLNHEAASYNVYRCTAATSGCSFLQSIPAVYANIYNATLYTFTDSSFTSGGPYWYGVAAVNHQGIEGELLSNTVGVTFGSGVYSANPAGVGAGVGHFDGAVPSAVTWTSASEEHLPDAHEAGAYPWSITQGSGGSLPDDYYWVFVTMAQCKDYPSCAQLTTKPPPASPLVNTIHVTGGSGIASITFQTSELDSWGQHAYQIWMAQATTNTEPAESAFTLQTCTQAASTTYLLPLYAQSTTNNTAKSETCTINAFSTATAIGTPADNTVQDFALTFTANPATDRVSYWDMYYAEGSAPTLKEGEDAAQPQLIASVPASYCTAGSACTWRDTAPSIGAVDAGTHIFYGIVPVAQNGARGGASCWDATAGASVACQ